MTLNYDFCRDDLLHWYRYSQYSSPSWRSQRSRFVASWCGLFFGLAGLASIPAFNSESWPPVILAFVLAAGFGFGTPKWYDQRIENALQALAADPQLEGGFGPIQLVLSNEGLREVTPATDSLVRWTSVIQVVADADHVYVRLVTGQAAVISRQSYSGPIAFEEIPGVIEEFRQRHSAK